MNEIEAIYNQLNEENQAKVNLFAKGIEVGQNGVYKKVEVDN